MKRYSTNQLESGVWMPLRRITPSTSTDVPVCISMKVLPPEWTYLSLPERTGEGRRSDEREGLVAGGDDVGIDAAEVDAVALAAVEVRHHVGGRSGHAGVAGRAPHEQVGSRIPDAAGVVVADPPVGTGTTEVMGVVKPAICRSRW